MEIQVHEEMQIAIWFLMHHLQGHDILLSYWIEQQLFIFLNSMRWDSNLGMQCKPM